MSRRLADPTDKTRLSPLKDKHVNVLGRYAIIARWSWRFRRPCTRVGPPRSRPGLGFRTRLDRSPGRTAGETGSRSSRVDQGLVCCRRRRYFLTARPMRLLVRSNNALNPTQGIIKINIDTIPTATTAGRP
jgi:hypothetical protein